VFVETFPAAAYLGRLSSCFLLLIFFFLVALALVARTQEFFAVLVVAPTSFV
jgi:hypothetical protein